MIFKSKGEKGRIEELEARVKELEQQNQRFREALKFYAEPTNWEAGHKYRDLDDATIFEDKNARGVDADWGVKAREALG